METRKSDSGVSLAWKGPMTSANASIYVDCHDDWPSRRRLMKQTVRDCFDLLIPEGALHDQVAVAETFHFIPTLGHKEFVVIAANLTVIPTLAFIGAIMPVKLLLVQPSTSSETEPYWHHLLGSGLEVLTHIPTVKMIGQIGNDTMRQLSKVLGQADVTVQERWIENADQGWRSVIKTPAYIETFASDG